MQILLETLDPLDLGVRLYQNVLAQNDGKTTFNLLIGHNLS